jgi:hypothetical protein
MASLRLVAYLALVLVTYAAVTPIEKVITLLEDMKKEVEEDGKAEAKSYDEFACFCKKTTEEKSKSVQDGNDKIDLLSADIADKTQSKEEDSNELLERKKKQQALSAKLEETNVRCAKEKAEYEVAEADLAKAISSLKKAIKAMSDSKPSAASLLSIRKGLAHTLELADAMNMVVAPKHKAIASLLQGQARVDPENPEYAYHSQDIIDLLDNLLKDFKTQKKELDDEYSKTSKACVDLKASLKKQMGANSDAMGKLEKNIEKLAKEIAQHRSDLVESETLLKDDELYLKDLAARCEERANDWDQRSSMRADEISALSAALKVLNDEVKPRDEVNVRAMLLQRLHKLPTAKHTEPVKLKTKVTSKPVSFLQGRSESFLSRGELALDAKRDRALTVLSNEGERLGSLVLTSLAARAAADPFKKVKGLIQKLIERLLAESRAEATKKGFCDTELGKARKDREYRFAEAKELNADLEGLEAKRDALEQEIKELTQSLKQLEKALKETTADRKEEKETNLETIKTAKEGLEAVTEALLILKNFYKQAAKASLVQASPVDEDTEGAGFAGSYKGNQSGSKAVLALLETIQSDFDRTVRNTEKAEEEAAREFVAFVQATKSSIGSKSTKKELNEQDLKSTKTTIKTKFEDLQNAMDLLDGALKELEELKPTCMDSGMSYKERVEKREAEMEALKKALCILDEEGVEAECK